MTIWLRRHARLAVSAVLLAALFALYIAIHPRGMSVYVMTIWSNQGALLALAALGAVLRRPRARHRPVGRVRGGAHQRGRLLRGVRLRPQVALGALAVLAVGIACGLANGAAVVYGRVPPIVATLASGSIYSGVALLLRPDAGAG